MTLEEIFARNDIAERINLLKQGRRTPMVDVKRLRDDWNPDKHEIMIDTQKYPKIKVTLEKEKQEWRAEL